MTDDVSVHKLEQHIVITNFVNLLRWVYRFLLLYFYVVTFSLVIFAYRGMHLRSFIKFFFSILLRSPLILQCLLPLVLSYPIESRISSPTTRVIFTHSKRANVPICLKAWQRNKNGERNGLDIA